MINPLIHAAEENFIYIATKIENTAKQALILLGKTISKIVYRVQFFFASERNEQRQLVHRVFNALGDSVPSTVYLPFTNLKNLGLNKINDFYDLEATRANICYAYKGTWEILIM